MTRQNDFLTGAYERQIDRIEKALRDTADAVARERKVSSRISQPYISGATRVVSTIHNMLPNLPLSLLIEAAHDCEVLTEDKS